MVRNILSWGSKDTPDLDNFLRVPFDYQPESEDECVIYSLWMVIQYFKNKHPNETLRKETNSLSTDEILEDMTIVKGGWKPDQNELTLISERTRTLNFNIKYWQDGAPKPLFDYVRSHIDRNRPLIQFINGPQLRKGKRATDSIHSVVIAGYGSGTQSEGDVIAVHYPWGNPKDMVEKAKLEDPWDPMFNQLITVTLSKRGKQIVGDSP